MNFVIALQVLKAVLDRGKRLMFPDGILINGLGPNGASFTVEPGMSNKRISRQGSIVHLLNFYSQRYISSLSGKTYRLRISNVGLQNSLNFRIQDHTMKLVEVEGTHTIQTDLSSLDVHVGQSYSVLVTAKRPPHDYYVAVSTRLTDRVLTTTAILHYSNSKTPVFGPPPPGPTTDIQSSLNQARSIRYTFSNVLDSSL